MTTKTASSSEAAFKGIRGIFWPIHNFELKKFLPMGLMMMCILFNYTILRDIKDTLVINAPGGGAECLSFLKLYGVTPAAILFMIIFMKLANVFTKERLFYVVLIPFLAFFSLFAFIIYPNKEMLHMSLETLQSTQAAMPNLHWLIPVIGNWSFSLFYILSELWGSVVLSMLFWQFANQISKVTEAKRFYGLFGMLGNVGLIISGQMIVWSSDYAASLASSSSSVDPLQSNLKLLMSLVAISGMITMFTYRWMHKNVLTDPNLYDPGQTKKKTGKAKLSIMESFKYILKNPYLGLIAVLVVSYGVTINLVEGVWKGQIKIAFPEANDYARFMGNFSKYTGIVTIGLMIIGNNILRKFSWTKAAIITPIMVLITSCVFFFFVWNGNKSSPFAPLMGTSVVMVAVLVGLIQNILSKGTKYSLFDSTKQMAYIPLDQESKLKGQGAVEVIGGRAGKSGGAFIQSTLLTVIGGSVSLASLTFILGPLVILVCGFWAFSVLGLGKKFTALLKSKDEEAAAATEKPAAHAKARKEPATVGTP